MTYSTIQCRSKLVDEERQQQSSRASLLENEHLAVFYFTDKRSDDQNEIVIGTRLFAIG